ncbi:uncharacterized protein LOC131637430 [Vicia villosa]|uniref:uncharacterized protein LOC131637430 n=1 Tax=Vicia villosa TaxID=3911 RepID=UPI00273B55BF|nr:uncharacterized protein LOC131637430 [Vicia villosa]
MTNKNGSERGKRNSKNGKSKLLAPGKLNDQRKTMFRKSPWLAHTPSVAPIPSVASTPSLAPTPLLAPIPSSAPTPFSAHTPSSTPTPSSAQTPSPAPTAPSHTSTSEVCRFMPTPGLNLQTMAGPSHHTLRETPIEENVEESDEEDEEEVVGEGNVEDEDELPIRDDDGKIILRICDKALVPGKEVAGAISYAIHDAFYGSYYNWTEVPGDIRNKWFGIFAKKVSWDPRDDAFVRKAFESKGSVLLNGIIRRVRLKGKRPEWIGQKAWDGLETYWKSDAFKKLSAQNKTNRSSARGGAVHYSGRKAHVDVALELSQELKRDVRPDELFLKTHKRKNGDWVDKRAESTYNAFKEKAGDGVETLDGGTVNEIWTDCAGGRSRGRVYGTADLAINLKKGSTNFVKPAKSSRGSMFRTSLESERAARVRAEQVAEATAARLQEATEAIRVSNEAARRAEEQAKMATEFAKKMESEFDKKMEREMNAFKAFIMKTIDTRHGESTSAVIPPSNPHYDEDLDDQFLDEP